MAFSGASYFAGVGTAFVAVALGFAGGALVTSSAVQPPNRLERVTSNAPLPANPSSPASEKANATSAERSPPSGAPSAAPSQKAESQPAQQPPPEELSKAKSDTAANSDSPRRSDTTGSNDAAGINTQGTAAPASSARNQPSPSAKSEDAAVTKNERAGARAFDSRRDARRKRADNRRNDDRKVEDWQADDRKMTDDRQADDRGFTDRNWRQDLDAATNTVRQMRRDNPPDQVIVERGPPRYVERDGPPRYVEERAPRSGFFGIDDDAPRSRGEGPVPFGFFGNN